MANKFTCIDQKKIIMAVKTEEIGLFEKPWQNSDAVLIFEDKELHAKQGYDKASWIEYAKF